MSKFYVETFHDYDSRHYYITFKTEKYDGVKIIAKELGIPIADYLNILASNGAYIVPNMSDKKEMFNNEQQAQNALQEALEYSIEYNKCDCDCNAEDYNKEYEGISPKFPEDFSKNEGNITDDIINKIIKECIIALEENDEIDSVTINDENIMITARKCRTCDDIECEGYNEYYYLVTVCKDVYECSFDIL